MRDIGPAHHAAEDRAQPRVVEHLLGEDDEGVMHIVLWYGSGDAVQISRSHVISNCTGLFMSWKYARRKAVVGGMFLAGIVCPLLLLLLMRRNDWAERS